MSRITVLGGSGYAGSAIVAEAARRGHAVTALMRSHPEFPVAGVTYVQADAQQDGALREVIKDADVVVAALSPRGDLAATFREVYRTVMDLSDKAGARLFVVGGFSSLRPRSGAARFSEDLSDMPASSHPEILAGAKLITDDLPAASDTLDWVFVSPPKQFGSWVPGEALGRYRLGGDVALQPEDGGAISNADYAIGMLDLIERNEHHRTQVNLAH